ncbi:MBL fold metallo-hydrolase [Runella sp.]|uniref:MBL fold metallo-hydrolase n=1 Tax=Runella sp. TaxID=1960881 RepID=UPI003D11715D
MQILKNLFQVSGDLNGITFDQPGALWNDGNAYVLKTPQGLILFDSGCGDTIEQLFDNMRYWGLAPEDIHYCLLTHPHIDHAGAAHILKKRGVKIMAIAETAEAIAAGDERCFGYLYHKTFQSVSVDQVLVDKQKRNLFGVEIEVMHLPGHSAGCTAYSFMLDQKRIIISGDVIGVQPNGDFGWDSAIDFDKQKYTASLRRLSKVDFDILLPGHGMGYFHKPRQRVEDAFVKALVQFR